MLPQPLVMTTHTWNVLRTGSVTRTGASVPAFFGGLVPSLEPLLVQAVAGAMTPKAVGRSAGTVRSCGCVRMRGAESTEMCNAVAVGTLVVQLASVRRRMPRVAEAVAL